MDIFAEYIQPITSWLYHHPHWALLATFLVSFSESLAFVGSIIPGTVTMTAFGILAGSGVMRIDLTLIAAILGAIAGDSASYSIGYVFSDRLAKMWPLNKYPQWLRYGKDYFEHHGGKSVLIGRFTGPLRSIIPIIAGMMRMNRWHFLIANVLSAIGWSLLYVVPGILIGTASSELSAQSASKLFFVVLCFLGIIWLLSLWLKWVFILINQWLHTALNLLWTSWMRSKTFGRLIRYITPQGEVDHYATAAMFIAFVVFTLMMPLFFYSYTHSQWIVSFNEAVHQFCLSIRTGDFDTFFIITRLVINIISVVAFGCAIILYAIYHRDWRLLKFWMSLICCSGGIAILMTYTLTSPSPTPTPTHLIFLAFPTRALMIATSLYGFLVCYMSAFYQQTSSIILRSILMALLFIAGIALIYLGEDWITNVILAYKIGFTNTLFHWILYRRKNKPHYRSHLPINLSIILMILATALSINLFYPTIAENQQPYTKQFDIRYPTWWNQERPLLPLYSTNRFGKVIGVMNIQYVGSIHALQETLEKAGWKKQLDSFFYSLMLRVGNKKTTAELPLMAQLYLNKKPYLLMTYGSAAEKKGYILRLWRSNYHIHNHNQVIWIGSIQHQKINSVVAQPNDYINALSLILNQYQTKKIVINPKKTGLTPARSTILLLIKEDKTPL